MYTLTEFLFHTGIVVVVFCLLCVMVYSLKLCGETLCMEYLIVEDF